MAYTFFPKQRIEIRKTLTDFPEDNLKEIESLFSLLKPKMDTPINIDPKKKSNVNVSRALSDDMSLADIKDKARLSNIKIKFGNGSSGNRGVNNRGNLFEPQFADALMKWWAGEEVNDEMLKSIQYLDKVYDFSNSNKFKVNVVGGENTRRPLQFGSRIQLANTKGKGFDVGKSVTDITVETDNKDVFLSLKLGGTTTFFNVGIKTILTKGQIQDRSITNANGKKLLKLFGIDEGKFCDVFNGDMKRGEVDRNPKFDKSALEYMLQSGIGFGYCIVHKKRGKIHTKKMDKSDMVRAARIQGKPTVFYGGKTGRGKRIDIEFSSGDYTFKLNFRDTQGGDGYPTRLMCDFTDKK